MKFEDMIQPIREGKKVRRPIFDGGANLNKDSNSLIDIEDLLADDWEVLDDEPKKIERLESVIINNGKKAMYDAHEKINEIIDHINKKDES